MQAGHVQRAHTFSCSMQRRPLDTPRTKSPRLVVEGERDLAPRGVPFFLYFATPPVRLPAPSFPFTRAPCGAHPTPRPSEARAGHANS